MGLWKINYAVGTFRLTMQLESLESLVTVLFNFLEFIIYIHTVHSFNKCKNVKIVLFICTEINSQSV